MYILTSHKSFVGLNEDLELVQLTAMNKTSQSLIKIEDPGDNQIIANGPMTGFKVLHRNNNVYFQKNGFFLCAEPENEKLVVNRVTPGLWEAFILIPELESANDLVNIFNLVTSNIDEVTRFGEKVNELVAKAEPVKIYCGCGPVPRKGFLNLDIFMFDMNFFITNPHNYFIFPFAELPWGIPNDCVDYIFHEDFIEHITQLQQIQFLAEAWRVLKPGCYHRINTPNLITTMRQNSSFRNGFSGVYTGEIKHGHQSIFSHASLKEMAELVGYRHVIFTTKNHGVSPFAEQDFRPGPDRDEIVGNIYADLQK